MLESSGFVLIFWVCILWVLKILGAQSLARGMESRKNNVVSVTKFVVQKWVCSKYQFGFYFSAQSGFLTFFSHLTLDFLKIFFVTNLWYFWVLANHVCV